LLRVEHLLKPLIDTVRLYISSAWLILLFGYQSDWMFELLKLHEGLKTFAIGKLSGPIIVIILSSLEGSFDVRL